jgi:SpoVK/Ycf46/Vps4 family AAA+-type ATPase
MTKHIKWLIDAAARADLEDQALDRKYSIDSSLGINPFDPEVIKRAFEINIEEDQIGEYLNGLDYDTLLKLEALMYFGRDGGTLKDHEQYFKELEDSKDEIIRTIVEKRAAYPKYFERAISRQKEAGIDINNIQLV